MVNLRALSLLLLAMLGPLVVCAQNCGSRDTVLTATGGSTDYVLEIEDLVSNNLAAGQGICGVELSFAHQYVYDLVITLTSPGGQTVTILGPENGQSRPPTIFARWFIDFTRCDQPADPDAGAPATWNNNHPFNWAVGGLYTGTYYPSNGCLEDFNTGSANGNWTLNVTSNRPGADGAIIYFRLQFCDETGFDCCFADAGQPPVGELIRCEAHPDLELDLPPAYNQPRPDSNEYAYTYLLAEGGAYLGIDSTLDLTGYAAGEYEICGFSYRRGELDSLPTPDGVYSLDDLRTDLASLTPTLCGDLTENCYRVRILAPPDTTFITTEICTGDTYAVGSSSYTTTGIYTDVLTGQGFCDSVVVLNLAVVDRLRFSQDTTICFGEVFAAGNSVYDQAGTYLDTIPSSFGCDSIITTNLTIREEDIATSLVAICQGESFFVGNEAFTTSTVTQRTLTNQFGCDSTVNLDLVVLDPQILLAPLAPLDCNNATISLNAGPSLTQQNTAYAWFNLAGQLLGTDPELLTDTAGTYVLELTESFRGTDCSVRDTFTIENLRTLPTLDVPPADTLTCTRTEVELGGMGTSAGPIFTYDWSGPPDAIFTAPTNQSITRVASPGTYQLLVVNTLTGCRDSLDVTVAQDTARPLATILGDTVLNCAIFSQPLAADTLQDRAEELDYDWLCPGGCPPPAPSPAQIEASVGGTHQLTVTNRNNGCVATNQVEIVVDRATPQPDVVPPATLTCFTPLIFLDGSNSSPAPRLSYRWRDAGGAVLGTVDSLSVSAAGNYELLLVDTVNFCRDSLSVMVSMDQTPPVADVGADTVFLNCLIPAVTVGGASSTGQDIQYAWTRFAAPADTLGTEPQLSLTDQSGLFVLSVLDTDNGCVSRDSVRVRLERDTPFVRIQEPMNFGCFTDSVALDASATFLGFDFNLNWSGGPCLSAEQDTTLLFVNCVGDYTLTVTNLENGCVGDSTVSVGLEPNAVIAVLPDQVEIDCGTGLATIDASNSTMTIRREWFYEGELTTLFGPMPQVGVPGTYTYVIGNFDGSCVDTATVEVVADCPILAAIVPPDSLTCDNPQVRLNAQPSLPQDPTGVSVEWLFDDPNCVLPGTNEREIIVVCPGEYGFVIRNALDGNVDTAFVTVIQDLFPPLADAGPNDTLNCYEPTLTLDGSGSEQDSRFEYAWTNASDDTLALSQTVDVGTPGIYLLRVLNTETGCSATDVVTVFRDVATPDLDFSNTFIPCREDSFALSVIPDPPGNYLYNWSGPLVVAQGSQDTVLLGQAGTYTATVTNLNNGCPTVADVDLEQLPCPPCPELRDTAFTCVSDLIFLAADFCEPCQGCTFRWFRNGDEITGATLSSLGVNTPGTYRLVAVNSFGLSGEATARVGDLRVLPELAAGPDRFLTCDSSQVTLGRTIIDTVFGFTYQWVDPAGNDIPGANNNFLVVSEPGFYGLRSSNLISECEALDSVMVGYDTLPPAADAGPDRILTCDNPLNVLNGQNSTTGSAIRYAWSGGPSEACLEGAGTLSPIVACGGTYDLVVRDLRNGCVSRDTVVVTASDSLPEVIPLADTFLSCTLTSILLEPFVDGPGFTAGWCTLDAQGDTIPGSCVDSETLFATSPATYQFNVENPTTGCRNGFSLTITEDLRPPTALTGANDTFYCTLDSLALTGAGQTQSGLEPQLQWTSQTGFTIGAANQDTAFAFQPDRYFLTVTDPLNGCAATDSIDFFLDLTAPTAVAGMDTTLNCQRRQLRLGGTGQTFSGQIQYNWATADGSLLADANSPMPLIDAAGAYLFSVTDPVNNCTTQDIVTVAEDTLRPQATLTPESSLLINCYAPTTTLDAAASQSPNGRPLSYGWRTQGAGTPLNGSTGPTVLIDQAGSYQLVVLDEVNRCRDTLPVAVTSDFAQPSFSFASPPELSCLIDSVTLVALAPADPGSYRFGWSDPVGTTLDSLPTQSVGQPGTYTLTVVDSLNGCERVNSLEVLADRQPPPLELRRSGTLNCETPFVILDAEGSAAGTDFTGGWSSSDGTFATDGTPYRIRAGEAGTYRFSLVDTTNGCVSLDSVVIDRDARFIDELALAVSDPPCAADLSGSLMVVGVNGGTPPYRFRVDGGLLTDRLVYEDIPVGTYEIVVVDSSGCERIETFTISPTGPVEVDLGPDQTINLGDSIALNFSSNRLSWSNLIWEGGDPVPAMGTPAPWVSPTTGVSYTLTLVDTNGCVGTDNIRIEVINRLGLYVANVFSPNGDNVNDLFFPQAGPQVARILRFEIYDRWGNQVHRAEDFAPNDPNFGWDGTLNNRPLNTNVFVWQLVFETAAGEVLARAGDVLLQR